MFVLHPELREILLKTSMSLSLSIEGPDKDSREVQISASFARLENPLCVRSQDEAPDGAGCGVSPSDK